MAKFYQVSSNIPILMTIYSLFDCNLSHFIPIFKMRTRPSNCSLIAVNLWSLLLISSLLLLTICIVMTRYLHLNCAGWGLFIAVTALLLVCFLYWWYISPLTLTTASLYQAFYNKQPLAFISCLALFYLACFMSLISKCGDSWPLV